MLLKISLLEIKKIEKKYGRKTSTAILLAIVFIIFSAVVSAKYGINSDKFIYKISSEYYIVNDPAFIYYDYNFGDSLKMIKYEEIDLYLGRTYIVTDGDSKSMSSADRLINTIKKQFEYELYLKYGEKAFPVLLNIHYLRREKQNITQIFSPLDAEKEHIDKNEYSKEFPKDKESSLNVIKETRKEDIKSFTILKETINIKPTTQEFELPSTFSPPSLLSKILYGFIFIIPPYFLMQVFASSLMEDRISRRIEVIIASPTNGHKIILGKMLPYIIASIIFLIITSIIFSVNSLIYILPPILFLFSLHAYISSTARSYKEMTFLLVVLNLMVISFLFLPTIFSGSIPFSKLSPVTLLLYSSEGEKISFYDYLLSTAHFLVMSVFLFYLSGRAMNIEILNSNDNLLLKTCNILRKTLKNKVNLLLASVTLIPFVFFIEFFLIFMLFIFPLSIALIVVLALAAFIEEFAKGMLIFSSIKTNNENNDENNVAREKVGYLYINAIIVGFGFFVGEKLLTFIGILKDYYMLALSNLLILPLLLHIASCIVFAYFCRRNFILAVFLASTLHFTYNYMIVGWYL